MSTELNDEYTSYKVSNPIDVEIQSIELNAGKEMTQHFHTALVGGKNYVLFPNNAEELFRTNYLFRLYMHCLSEQGYERKLDDKPFISKLKIDVESEKLLRSFGTVVMTKNLPKPPVKGNSSISKGIYLALNIWLGSKKGIDLNLFKTYKKGLTLHRLLLGDQWSIGYKAEAKWLSTVISYLRSINLGGDFIDYLHDKSVIIKENGLFVKYNNKLLYDCEKHYVQSMINLLDDSVYEHPETLTALSDIRNLQSHIQKVIKNLRLIKRNLSAVITRRSNALYPKSLTYRERKLRSKTPVEMLISDVRYTPDWYVFNPTLILPCAKEGVKISPRRINDKAEEEMLHKTKKKVLDNYTCYKIKIFVQEIFGEFDEFNKYLEE